jgi:competence protein ComEC
MKQWPLNKAYFWETAPFFRILLPFIAGIICYDADLRFPVLYALLLFFVAAAIFIFAAFRKIHHAITFTAIHLAIIVAGWLLSYYYDIRNISNWFGHQTNMTEVFVTTLTKDPQEKDKTFKLEVSVVGSLNEQGLTQTQGKAFVYVYKEQQTPDLKAGDTILIPNNWQTIKNSGNPFEFDYANYCRRNNILYQQFLSAGELVKHNSTAPFDRSITSRAHDYCTKTLEYYVKDATTLGILQAMLIGDEANFDPELRQAYAETGIIHVIAISGSHLTVFFFLISFLLSWIRNKKHQWIKYAIAIPLIWFYVVMAGAPPSAVRAAAMFSLLAIGFMLQKSSNSLNQLLATAFILLCAEPMWIFSVGFQLSFIAVLALVLFYLPIYRWYTPSNKLIKLIWATTAASIAAELLVAPIVIYYFHIFPVLFIVANIIAYCFMGIVLILGMAIILFSLIAPIAKFIAAICTVLTSFFNRIIVFLHELNPRSFGQLQLSELETVVLYIAIVCFAVYFIQKTRRALFIGLAAACVLLTFICYDEWTALHQERIVVYNMNRGSHIEYIKGKQHQIIYTDTTVGIAKKQYTLNAAHTAWRTWETCNRTGTRGLLQIGNKTVLLLAGPIHPEAPISVDYMVLNYPANAVDITLLQKTYRPKLIIVSGHISRRTAEECKKLAVRSHINLHTTALDGAYVIEAL